MIGGVDSDLRTEHRQAKREAAKPARGGSRSGNPAALELPVVGLLAQRQALDSRHDSE
jgi:hypothetical protein